MEAEVIFGSNLSGLIAQFLRFAGVGILGTAVHYAILILLVHAGASGPIFASSCGFVGGAFTNYFLNYRYTFHSAVTHFVGLPKFFTVAAAGLLLNSLVMSVAITSVNLHYLIAQIVATAIVLIWNFLGNRIWTFKESSYEQGR